MTGINGVIINKLSRLDDYLDKLRSKAPVSFDQFKNNWELRLLTERILQVLVEIIIDVADRIISMKNWGPASSSGEAIEILHKKGVISNLEPYISMVKFRNIIVHNYDAIEPTIVYGIVTKNTGDFEKFKKEILAFADSEL